MAKRTNEQLYEEIMSKKKPHNMVKAGKRREDSTIDEVENRS